MLVSIIVPVYNMEEHLTKCINSVLSQSYHNIEIICVNDCSTDNSLSLLYDFQQVDPRVKVIDLKVNVRQGGARNAGIEFASGDYIYFIDSDDWVEPELIESLISRTTGIKNEIVYCNYTTRNNDPALDRVVCRNNVDWDKDNLDEIKRKLILAPSPIWTALYSSEIFKVKEIRFPERVFYEDNFIVPVIICNADKISKVEKSLINYNMKNISVTRTFNNDKFFERIITAKLLIDEVRNDSFYDRYRSELEFYIINIYLINTTIGCYRKFYPVKHEKAGDIIEEFTKLFPEFRNNKYFKDKIKSKFLYRAYFMALMKFRNIIKIIYSMRNAMYYNKSS
ncbi:glycosyltransferase family 2 protein [Vibrio sp. SCSIO 43009]|nr:MULTISPECIES: glycosyltransferase family 2 protein [Vibrio]ELC9556457.1 glycosyltransferase family 2 protein [Vibrio alginolyticus]USD73945.1 glycosyltransferase family 2 protein [Vibrio sp. SCSIO 43009]